MKPKKKKGSTSTSFGLRAWYEETQPVLVPHRRAAPETRLLDRRRGQSRCRVRALLGYYAALDALPSCSIRAAGACDPALDVLPPVVSRAPPRHADALSGRGASRPSRPNIRGSILSECANRTDACVVVDCSGGRCAHDPVRYMRPMLRAVQVLPAAAGGDADAALHVRRHPRRLRARVLRGPAARRQYGWHLPPVRYGEFSVHMPKEAAVFGGVRIVETLEAVPEEEVRRMRQRALEMAPRVVYRRHGSTPELRQAVNDAVDLAVDGVLQRIRRRTHALEEGLPERLYAQEEDSVSVDI
jgi:hypothetical protein|uniref:Uncharacterized protein n=1 Tax=Zea mays TaxID=4577 RepID=A0A804R8V6_MAIZE